MVQLLWGTVWRFLIKLKRNLPYDPAIPLLGTYPEKIVIQKDAGPLMFIAALHKTAQTWNNLNVHWQRNVVHIYTEYYSAIKRNEIMPFAATQIKNFFM